MLVVARVDPQRVVIAVALAAHHVEGAAAVDRLVGAGAGRVDDLGVGRIDANLAVVHRSIVVVAAELPGLAAVVRAPDAARAPDRASAPRRAAAAAAAATTATALAGLHERAVVVDAGAGAAARSDLDLGVDDVRLRAADAEADAAEHRVGRQAAAGQPRPGLAGVVGAPDAAAGTAAVEAPRLPPPLVRRREQGVGVGRVHHDVDEAGVVVDELRVGPGLAAVAGLVEAALRVGPEEVPDRGDVDDVGILGMDDHAADRLGFLQPDILEGLAGVGGLVDAGAERRALAVVGLAGADVEDVGIRLRQGEVADRRHRLLVEERRPGRAVVDGLPQAAGRVGDVDHRRVGFIDGDVVDASAHHRRADRAPDEALEHRVVRLVDRAQRRDRRGGSLRLCAAAAAGAPGSPDPSRWRSNRVPARSRAGHVRWPESPRCFSLCDFCRVRMRRRRGQPSDDGGDGVERRLNAAAAGAAARGTLNVRADARGARRPRVRAPLL